LKEIWIEVGKEKEFKEEMLKNYPNEWYRCDSCGKIYKKGASEDEMKKEYKENFPNDPEMKIPRAIFCDDCYQKLYKQTKGFTEKPSFNYFEQWGIDNES